MNDQSKTKHDLIQELVFLRKRIAELSQYESERRQADESLRESEYKYKSLIENIPDIIFTIDLEGKITFISKRTKEILGYENEETINRSIFNFIPEEAHQSTLEKLQNGMKGEKIKHVQLPLTAKSGEKLFFEFSFSRIYKDGAVVGAQGTAVDITERKQVEELLKQSEAQYRLLADHMKDYVWLMDLNLQWTYISPSVEKSLGYTLEELKQLPLDKLLTATSFQMVMDVFSREMETALTAPSSTTLLEIECHCKDGRILWIEAALSFIRDENRKPLYILGEGRDITDHKRTEEKLCYEEQRFRALADQSSDIILLINTEGTILYENCAVDRILGLKSEERIGKNVLENLHPDDLHLVTNAFNILVGDKNAPPQRDEIRLRHVDGTWRTLEVVGSNLTQDNIVQALIINLRDITERKKAEEALRESEQFLRETQSIALMGGWKANPETDFLQWTEGVYRIIEAPLDYHPDLTEGMKYYTPETIEILKGRIMNTLTTNEPFAEECEIVTETGKKLWAEVRGLSHVMEGQTPCVIGTIQDITERKKVEEALKNSEAKYRNIFENAIEGIFQSTIEGKIITANAAIARMAGYDSPEELIESIKNIGTQLYVHPEDRKRFMEIRDAKGFVEGFEVEFYKKDGSRFWVVINARTVKDEQGEILYLEGLIEDITIRKHSEELLHQTLDSLKNAVGATIHVLVSAVEARDPYTAGHQIRSADLARTIATEMGLNQEKIDGIRIACSIHDIGKLSIPAEILSKPTKLTEIEFSLIKEHSRCGYEMLKDVDSPWPLAEIVYQHHERMDGSGYPRNLKGDDILMEARIMAVADVVEAMASHRPYRPTLGIEAALEEIEKNKGILYDNTVANTCLRLFRDKGFQLT